MRVVVVGTGTDVGKTFVACQLCRELHARGAAVVGLKPIETGLAVTGRAEDAVLLAEAAGSGPGVPRYGFDRPRSPHLEARRLGVRIEVGEVVAWVNEHAGDEVTVVETAGGLLSPISRRATNLDLVRTLVPDRLVIVAADRLGALHDVAAVRWVLRDVGLWGRGVVVLSAVEPADGSAGTNAEELRRLGWTERVVGCPRGGGDARGLLEALALA